MGGPPVFLLGIQRGGTNQVLNILRSHPGDLLARGRVPRGVPRLVRRAQSLRREGAARGWRASGAATRRSSSPRAISSTPTGSAAGAARRPPRPRGGARARRLGGGNRPSVARYKAALRRARLHRRRPRPDRMTVKVDQLQPRLRRRTSRRSTRAPASSGLIRDAAAVCEGHIARGGAVAAAAEAWAFAARRLDRARGGGAAAPGLALRGSRRRPRRRGRRDLRLRRPRSGGGARRLPAGQGAHRRRGRGLRRHRQASIASTASTRWAGTCAPTPTRARARGCRRRRWPAIIARCAPVLRAFRLCLSGAPARPADGGRGRHAGPGALGGRPWICCGGPRSQPLPAAEPAGQVRVAPVAGGAPRRAALRRPQRRRAPPAPPGRAPDPGFSASTVHALFVPALFIPVELRLAGGRATPYNALHDRLLPAAAAALPPTRATGSSRSTC